jgi:type II secretory pathway component GspD/PulD (secretin)
VHTNKTVGPFKLKNSMKRILTALVLGIAVQPIAWSQTATPGANQPAADAMVTNAPTAATAVPAAGGVSNQTVEANGPDTNAPAPAANIPTILLQDVTLTSAIENLARSAGINYLLDPKIGYGQPDQNGQPKPEPTISIRWENITAEQALLALLDNYGLQLVPDKRTHIARITTKDPTAPTPLITRVIQLKYAGVTNMTAAVESVLSDKRSRVLPDSRTSQLIVVATDPEQSIVDTLVGQLDKPTRQVLIESRLVEVSSNPQSSKGIDWSSTLSGQNISFGNGTLNQTASSTATSIPGTPTTTTFGGHSISTQSAYSTVTSLATLPGNGVALNTLSGFTPDIGFLNADGLKVVLSFLNSSADAQIISTPRIVTLDNEMAELSVVQGYPVFNVAAGSANNAGGSTVTYTNVGTILHVTPRISANDYIWLKVIPEVSSFAGNFSQSVTIGTSANGTPASALLTAPLFQFRTFQTQVLIPNANTLVMGGLVNDNPQSTSTKVPFMGDIPVLGNAFRSQTKSMNKVDLLIFITPTIVRDADFEPNAHAGDFLKSDAHAKLPVIFDSSSSWNSTTGDWSDLYHKQATMADPEPQ